MIFIIKEYVQHQFSILDKLHNFSSQYDNVFQNGRTFSLFRQ